MTTLFMPPEYSCSAQVVSQPASDFPLVLMSPPNAYQTNCVDLTIPDQYTSQFFSQEPAITSVQPTPSMQYLHSSASLPFFADTYGQSFAPTLMTKLNPGPQVMLSGTPFFQFATTTTTPAAGQFEQCQEPQQESMLCRVKRQKDENYRYSLGCISRRVRSWLERSKPYAQEAQTNLEDLLVSDSTFSEGGGENVLDLFEEDRKKRFMLSYFTTTSSAIAPQSDHQIVSCSAMSNPLLYSAQTLETSSSNSPRLPDELHSSNPTEPDYLFKFPKQIPAICDTAGEKVRYEELTDRSVLRNWRCRTDDGDLILKKGRKRFFKRVAVLPPDSWVPNKRPQIWEWAPSGPFALNLGEYVSISGTNGYPYEIVLIRHIPPAVRCFISLIPAPRELAAQMLNGERISPESNFVVHVPVDSVTHKWILNGVRPRDFTKEMAVEFINKDIEMEKAQKERKKTKKGNISRIDTLSTISSSTFMSSESLVTPTPEDELIKSSGSNEDDVFVNGANALVI